jgi:hypothetical protein
MKDISRERTLILKALLDLEQEGEQLEAEVKEVTDDGMRCELSY